jgi:hypothetical protein
MGTETGNPSWTHPWPTPGPTPTVRDPQPGSTTGTHYRDHYRDPLSRDSRPWDSRPGPTSGTLPGSPGPTLGPILGPTTGPILAAHDPLPAPLPAIEPPLQSQDQHLDPLPNSPRTPSNSFPSSTLGLLVSDILGLLWSNHYMKLVRVSQSHFHNLPAGDQSKSQRHDHSG